MGEDNTSDNSSDITIEQEIQFEETNQLYLIAMTTISIVLLLFMIVAVVALRRTKSTPETARFLSSGLLFFDITGTISFTLRRFVVHRDLNIFVQVLGVNSVFLAYVTVGVMSLERFIIFYSPHFYLRNMTPVTIKRVVTSIWGGIVVTYFFVRYGLCFIVYDDATMVDVVGRCNTVSYAYYGFFFVLTCIISAACYIRIFLIEKDGNKLEKPKGVFATFRALMRYKTTSIVFLYIISIYLTTLSYSCILLFMRSSQYATRISTDITNMTSCILDPCLYVLWFRECRYEVMKMFVCCSPRLSIKLEDMRMEIFSIVTMDKKKMFKNKIEPLQVSETLCNSQT